MKKTIFRAFTLGLLLWSTYMYSQSAGASGDCSKFTGKWGPHPSKPCGGLCTDGGSDCSPGDVSTVGCPGGGGEF